MISETSLAAEQTAFLNLLCRGPECGNIIKYSIAGKKVKRTCASSRTEALVSTVNNGNTYVTVNCNTGDCNTGNSNTGNCNIGDRNTGSMNTGDWNTGNCNTGYYNTGYGNIGDYNTGDWNKSSFNTGCFNTEEQKIMLFNKPSDITYREWIDSDARELLNQIPKNVVEWVDEEDMTDEEKTAYPTYETMGGYLKVLDESECGQLWWNELSDCNKQIIKSIPNFDPDIFYECTGIKVTE